MLQCPVEDVVGDLLPALLGGQQVGEAPVLGDLGDRVRPVGRVPLHGLRHTCVSLLLALGTHPRVVMEIVGHSAIEMTMNVYGHVDLDTQRAALNHLDDELSG